MFKSILITLLVLSTSAARAGTIYSGLEPHGPHYHESDVIAELLVNGQPHTHHAMQVEAMYQSHMDGSSVGFRSTRTRPHVYPTLRLHYPLRLWMGETAGGTVISGKFLAVGGSDVTYESTTGELPAELSLALWFTRNGVTEFRQSARFTPAWDEPMTASPPVPVPLPDRARARLVQLPNVVGPWDNQDVTLFAGNVFGEAITLELERFGFTNRTRDGQHVVLGVPEPPSWLLVPILVIGFIFMRICQRQWPGGGR